MKSIREELETIIARAEGLELSIDRLNAEIISLNQQKQTAAKEWAELRAENTRLREELVGPVRKHNLLAAVNEAIRVGLVPQSTDFNDASAYVFKVHDILVAARNAKPDSEEVKSAEKPVTCGDCLLFPCWAECTSADRTCHGFKRVPKGRKKGGRGK